MIEYIKGEVAELNPAYVVIEAGGIGYLINISLQCFSALESMTTAKLLIHEVIREDAHNLYGFLKADERAMFELLVGVSGVGANTARMILSSMTVDELGEAIAAGQSKRLKSIKGIGLKTAERIIVDLKDKIKAPEATLIKQSQASAEVFDEALAALVMLGFQRQLADKTLTAIFNADPATKVEAAIKKALTMM